MNYKIADINSNEFKAIKDAENLVKKETGKDFVLIAWEKSNN
ncbi:hypothetical protein SAMN04487886_106112 [Clostridium sp. DSM 8431]|nr:hypothetical protein [Clostridium sp. DSM 8431]SFU57126.1 hypothetical protein SAMN04487886_106112 [Clostridium sp. DSM 8431]